MPNRPVPQSGCPHTQKAQKNDPKMIFWPTRVPEPVLDSIIDQWLVPCLIEEFLRERGLQKP